MSLSIFQIWHEQSLADANSPTAYFKRKQIKTGETCKENAKNLSTGTQYYDDKKKEIRSGHTKLHCHRTWYYTDSTDAQDKSVHVSIEWTKQSSIVIILKWHTEIHRISIRLPLFTIFMIYISAKIAFVSPDLLSVVKNIECDFEQSNTLSASDTELEEFVLLNDISRNWPYWQKDTFAS